MATEPVTFAVDGNSVKVNGVEVGGAVRFMRVERTAGQRHSIVTLELITSPPTIDYPRVVDVATQLVDEICDKDQHS